MNQTSEVSNLLKYKKWVQRSLPSPNKDITHNGEDIFTMAKVSSRRDERYIKFEEILNAAEQLKLIDSGLKTDLLEF